MFTLLPRYFSISK